MRATRIVILLLVSMISLGCASNGSHMYVEGKCISCWNNPITQETLDYATAGANNYPLLSWKEMMLEGLARKKPRDLAPYGADYLQHQIGLKAHSLKNNEIAYQKAVNRSVRDLGAALNQHKLKTAYQITVSSQIGKYNFANQEFPIRLAKKFKLQGGSNIATLPRHITVLVENQDALPNLKMDADTAESFLDGRNSSKGLYLRYIIEITEMVTERTFKARVREIQFIDVRPSSVTSVNKEKHQPFLVKKI
ncbi:DUF4852 domain-containing protein [Pelagibaculum spongiae]|uniref:DUF4852 domain-containing protein n=1 Tax=Pelagibaculum spongiae TaxID=2080658 RepID=A0A2V1GRE9_9GAMM|nr:DUF4852 domain-containing protein [Pelagibaculum spongiae]PVZ66343.1 hypothetical protein DC094_16735 [Pelagibaculum spongiae]